MIDDAFNFRIIRCGDRDHLQQHHPQAAHLVSHERLSALSQFPGANPDFPLFCYLQNANRVCSYLRIIPDEVTAERRTRPWAWTADNFTYPEFRGRGLSTRLQQRTTDHLHGKGIGRGSVFSTHPTRHIFRKLGFTFVGFAKRYLLSKSAAPLLKAHIEDVRLRRLIEAASRPVVWAGATCLRAWNRALQGGTIRSQPSSFPELELTHLLDRLAANRRVHFNMSVGLLKRKLEFAKKTGEISLWLIHDARSGDCLAYMILRERLQEQPLAEIYRDFRLMTLMDFGFAEAHAQAARAIVGHTIAQFFQSNCEVLQIISNDCLIHRAAVQRGLLRVGKGMSFTNSVPDEWNWPASLAHLECWPLTNFCGDGFTF